MNYNNKKRSIIVFMLMAFILLLLVIMNAFTGSVGISVKEILTVLGGFSLDEVSVNIVWNIRLPRIFAAVILGGALAVSGYLLQTFFSNPIAGPFVLGISSGAKLFVALAMIFLLGSGVHITSAGMVASAFCGALLVLGFVLLASLRVHNMSLLIICGVMTGYICNAITDFAVTFADDANLVNLHNWSLGSFSGTDWEEVWFMGVIVFVSFLLAFFMSKPISAFLLGENYARSIGVDVLKLRVLLIILSSLLSACVTAFAGPISFVGMAVPHLSKTFFKSSSPLVLIPGCFLTGSIITLFCDLIARTVFAPTELSISSVTAVLMVPVVLWVLLKRKRGGL